MPRAGTRKVPFSKVLYIEQDDFREDPPKQYFRLSPGREVRLRYGYFVTCTSVVKDDARRGDRSALHLRSRHARRQCARRPQGEGDHPLGLGRARRRRRGAPLRQPVHRRKIPNEVAEGQDFTANLNPNSLEVLAGLQAGAEPAPTPRRAAAISSSGWATSASIRDSTPGKPVFNRTVALQDTWAKIEKRTGQAAEMIILGIGGLLGDAAAARAEGRRTGGRRRRIETGPAPHALGRRGEMPEHAIAECLRLAGAQPEQVDCVAVVRPFRDRETLSPEAARAVSQQPNRRGGASPGPRRVGLLRVALRRGHRAHARSRAAISAAARAGRRAATQLTLRARAVLPRFARRSLRARHRTARLRGQRRTNTRCSGSPSPATSASRTCSAKFCSVTGDWPRLDRVFFEHGALDARRLRRAVLRAARPGRWRGQSRRRCARTSPPACSAPSKTP